MNSLGLVKKESLQISDIVAVTLYIKDMSNYISINEVYTSCLSKTNPPVRVCVECPLNVHVVLDAIAYKETQDCGDKKVHKRHTMHVQSISHWAPANIGPYSQAVRVSVLPLKKKKTNCVRVSVCMCRQYVCMCAFVRACTHV